MATKKDVLRLMVGLIADPRKWTPNRFATWADNAHKPVFATDPGACRLSVFGALDVAAARCGIRIWAGQRPPEEQAEFRRDSAVYWGLKEDLGAALEALLIAEDRRRGRQVAAIYLEDVDRWAARSGHRALMGLLRQVLAQLEAT